MDSHNTWIRFWGAGHRDPIEEADSPLLYCAGRNDLVNGVDSKGQSTVVIAPAAAVAGVTVVAAAACAAPFVIHAQSQGPEVWTNDKYAHCVVSCRLSKACTHLISAAGGYSKELADEIKRQLGGTGVGWEAGDIAANGDGRSCAGWAGYAPVIGWVSAFVGESCHCCCAKKPDPQPIVVPKTPPCPCDDKCRERDPLTGPPRWL